MAEKNKNKKMKRYLFVIELKKDFVEPYCDIHRNPWSEIVKVIKEAGAKELLIWHYKNQSILYYECEDLNKHYKKLGSLDVVKRWDETIIPWLAESPLLDSSDNNIKTCEKIFDLNQQLEGKLEQY